MANTTPIDYMAILKSVAKVEDDKNEYYVSAEDAIEAMKLAVEAAIPVILRGMTLKKVNPMLFGMEYVNPNLYENDVWTDDDYKEKTMSLLAEIALTKEQKEVLNKIYGVLWTEAYYDPFDERTQKFAKPLSDLMTELNKELKFKI